MGDCMFGGVTFCVRLPPRIEVRCGRWGQGLKKCTDPLFFGPLFFGPSVFRVGPAEARGGKARRMGETPVDCRVRRLAMGVDPARQW